LTFVSRVSRLTAVVHGVVFTGDGQIFGEAEKMARMRWARVAFSYSRGVSSHPFFGGTEMSRFTATCAAHATRSILCWSALLAAILLAAPHPSAFGAITPEGDVLPANPSAWDSTTVGYIGRTAAGTLTVDGQSDLLSYDGEIGFDSAGTGVVNVAGSGSTWTNYGELEVGNYGSGTLSITSGGSVESTFIDNYGITFIGRNAGAKGLVTVDGAGSTWANDTNRTLYVGFTGQGTLSITNGGNASNFKGLIGCNSDAVGVVTVAGAGSKWTPSGDLLAVGGYYGTGVGTLSITNGGNVTSGNVANYLGCSSIGESLGSKGMVIVDGAGSTWTDNNSSVYVGDFGGGTISVSNGAHINTSTATIGNRAQSQALVAVNGAGSVWNCTSGMNVNAGGTLSITAGGSVTCTMGRLGSTAGAKGVVDGLNSTWNINGPLIVGANNLATLSITRGAKVINDNGFVSDYTGSTGIVKVDGAGSTWTNNLTLYVGYVNAGSGTGTLSILGGAAVTAGSVSIDTPSLLAIDVGRGSSLVVAGGTGAISNSGKIRVLAGAGVPDNINTKYAPISAGSWGGTLQSIGGTWDSTARQFTASSVASGTAGSGVALNLASVQRALVSGTATNDETWTVGASFLAADYQTDITFLATTMTDPILNALKTVAPGDHSVLEGWTLSTLGYTVDASHPAYLSFDVGAACPADKLRTWHYDGSAWTEFVPFDLTYDGTYASFTVTGFSGYALTVPEPGTMALFAIGLLGLAAFVGRRWRRS
jgi:T5SS/PEP-CTERM-associated repeat protein